MDKIDKEKELRKKWKHWIIFKPNDDILCKKNYIDTINNITFRKNHLYKIKKVINVKNKNILFYIYNEEYKKGYHFEYRTDVIDYNPLNTLINNFFYSKQKTRELKLKKIIKNGQNK